MNDVGNAMCGQEVSHPAGFDAYAKVSHILWRSWRGIDAHDFIPLGREFARHRPAKESAGSGYEDLMGDV